MWTGFLPYSAILKKSSREHQNANGFNIIFPHRVMKEGMFILQKIQRINEGVWKHGQLETMILLKVKKMESTLP